MSRNLSRNQDLLPDRRPSTDLLSQPATVEHHHNEQDSTFNLYEEKVAVRTEKIKTGEVKVSKQIITETAEGSIPIIKEKIVIEITSVYSGTRLDFADAKVLEDGTLSMDIYEDSAVVTRQASPYQTVSVRKETIRDTQDISVPVRKEILDVQTEGDPQLSVQDLSAQR